MFKQRIEYTSLVDALVALARRLGGYEHKHAMTSEEFFDAHNKARIDDDAEFIEWANDYRHYLVIRQQIENKLKNIA